ISGTTHDGQSEADRAWASWFAVTPRAFDALGLAVLAGRPFDDNDLHGRQPVAMLSRTAAERYFDRIGDALGRTIAIHDARTGDRRVTIVGVVSDTRDNQLIRTSPQLYVPIDQWPVADLTGVIRTAGEPVALAGDVRQIMRRLDPDVAVSDLKPLTQIIHEELSSTVIINGLFLAMGGLALALASAGLFGVISYSVGQRRREFGIRLALGAAPRVIARQIVVEGLRVTAIGMAIGLLLAFGLARIAETTLVGITPRDPATFVGVSLVVIAVALAASWGPALRAMHVDPARTLRAE
ncbi:MAG TPA: FtsX-like permease family protein, partial [Vicinamibacterales bacterium]|nr:FtsX-like permease family protein [Vicinamibacterales bacterium]